MGLLTDLLGDGNGTSRHKSYGEYIKDSGGISAAAGTLVTFTAGSDITLAAAAGDLVEIGILIQDNNTAVGCDFNVATIVGGSEVSRVGGTGTTGTIGALRMPAVAFFGKAAQVPYTVKAADVAAGQVTFRILVKTDSGANKNFYASSAIPFKWYTINLGSAAS